MILDISYEVLFIFLLVVANGLFAMSEAAIISARKARLQQMVDGGDAGARAALDLANAPDRFLPTVQIGVTLVGILAGAFGGATIAEQLAIRLSLIPDLAPYAEAVSIGVVVLCLTYLSLIIGELVPKRLALNSSERIASAVARPISTLSRIASPAVRFLSFSTEAVLRLLGAKPSAEPPVTEEEIKIMIEQGTQVGVFEEAEEDMVKRVFRLGDRQINALMRPRPDMVWIDVEDGIEQAQRKITESHHSCFPLCRGNIDDVLGVVHVKDLLAHALKGQPPDLSTLVRHPLYVPETMPALKALELFKQSGTHFALVTDEYGGIQGLVTLSDVLEAIVGDVPPAGRSTEPLAVQREDGSWLLDGMLPIDEFEYLFQLQGLPPDEKNSYQTLGGLVMLRMNRVPSPGDRFEWEGLRFEVMDMDGHRVDKVLVTPAQI